MPNARDLLGELGLSEAESKAYLCLTECGILTANELTKQTRMKRPTVYYALRQLVERGLVSKTGTPGTEHFQAASAERLLDVLEHKRIALDDLRKQTETLIPTLVSHAQPRETSSSISFYEGERAMQQAVSESLYCRNGKIDYITPHDNFFWQTENHSWADAYIHERARRGINTRHLWEQLLDPAIMRQSSVPLERIRILAKEMRGKFKTTVLMYDETVMYVSSKKSGYALVVRSKEHHDLLESIFEMLWNVSQPTTSSPSPTSRPSQEVEE